MVLGNSLVQNQGLARFFANVPNNMDQSLVVFVERVLAWAAGVLLKLGIVWLEDMWDILSGNFRVPCENF